MMFFKKNEFWRSALSICLLLTSFAFASEQGLLFHLSFEETLDAEFAQGNKEGSQNKPEDTVKYIEGVKGNAVLLDNGSIYYDARENLKTSRGTVTFWAKPVNWDPAKPSANWIYFFALQQRTTPGVQDRMQLWRYPETMLGGKYNYYSAQGPNDDTFILPDMGTWEKGEWRFFALTWDNSKDIKEFFADGRRISRSQRKKDALPVDINHIQIAASGTAYDEFKIFDRVLSEEEIAALFAEHSPGDTKPSAGTSALDFPELPPTASAVPAEGAIVIDGLLDEPAWNKTVEFRDMALSTGSQSPINRTSWRVAYNKKSLFVGATVYQQGEPKATVREHGGAVYTDDSVELFIAPEAGGKEYYQFVVNSVGARYEGKGMDGTWNGQWHASARRDRGRWYAEIEIPFSTIGVVPEAGKMLGFNATRNDRSAEQSQTWVDLGGAAFHRPDRFGRLVLAGTPVGVSGASMVFRKDGNIGINARMVNPASMPLELKWFVAGNAGGRSFRFEEIFTLQGKEEKVVEKTGYLSGLQGNAGWRSALWAGDELLYLSPGRTAEYLDLPAFVAAREPVTLANGKISLGFDAHSGALLSMKNLDTGLELIPRGEAQPLFSLDTVSYEKCPLFFEEKDVIPMESTNDSSRGCRTETRADGTQVFIATHSFPQGVEAEVTVELPTGTEISRWSIKVENSLPLRPRDAVIVHRVVFPHLGGLRAAKEDKLQRLAWPLDMGMLISEPAKKLPAYSPEGRTVAQSFAFSPRIEYPGRAIMSWVDLSGPEGGLYLAGHDAEPVISTTYEATGDRANSEVSLAVRRWSLLWPGKRWQPQPISVGIHNSDWHWSADRYKEWFYATVPVRKTPQWVYDEVAWAMDGGGANRATFADINNMIITAQNMGINYLQSWQHHMRSYETGESLVAMQMPNVYGGREEEFIAAIENVHKRGGRIGFYFNASDVDMRIGGMMRQPKYFQKLPEDIKKMLPAADPIEDGWLDMVHMLPDGSQKRGWPDGIDIRHACHGSKGWSDWVYFWVMRYVKKYKADTWYQDISPWSAMNVCFHPDHGHEGPIHHAQAHIDLGNRIARDAGPDFGIIGESMCDRMMSYQTHSLWVHGAPQEDAEPGLFIYTHPKFPLFGGGYIGYWFSNIKEIKRYGIKLTAEEGKFLSIADLMRVILLYGQRFDSFGASILPGIENMSAADRERWEILELRRAVNADLNRSSFRDRLGLSAAPEGVETRLFVMDSGNGALVTALDQRQEKVEFNLALDTTLHNIKLPVKAELVLPGGRIQKLDEPEVKGRIISIKLPGKGEKISVIRITSAR